MISIQTFIIKRVILRDHCLCNDEWVARNGCVVNLLVGDFPTTQIGTYIGGRWDDVVARKRMMLLIEKTVHCSSPT